MLNIIALVKAVVDLLLLIRDASEKYAKKKAEQVKHARDTILTRLKHAKTDEERAKLVEELAKNDGQHS